MAIPGAAVAPSEFPPPFDEASSSVAPTDPEDERIEVGVAIVGGGPAGLACANRLMQLLEDEPELTESWARCRSPSSRRARSAAPTR